MRHASHERQRARRRTTTHMRIQRMRMSCCTWLAKDVAVATAGKAGPVLVRLEQSYRPPRIAIKHGCNAPKNCGGHQVRVELARRLLNL
jgi:hypothetical protein